MIYFKPKHKNGRKDNLQNCNAFPTVLFFNFLIICAVISAVHIGAIHPVTNGVVAEN